MADDPAPTSTPSEPLSNLQLAVLALEERPWQHQGVNEQAIRDHLDLSATAYYQVLNRMLDDERAVAHSPVVINRLSCVLRHRLGWVDEQ